MKRTRFLCFCTIATLGAMGGVWLAFRPAHTPPSTSSSLVAEREAHPIDESARATMVSGGVAERRIFTIADLLAAARTGKAIIYEEAVLALSTLNDDDRLRVLREWAGMSDGALKFALRDQDGDLFSPILLELAALWAVAHAESVNDFLAANREFEDLRISMVAALVDAGKTTEAEVIALAQAAATGAYALRRACEGPQFDYYGFLSRVADRSRADSRCLEAAVDAIAQVKSTQVDEFMSFITAAGSNGWLTQNAMSIAASMSPPADALDWLASTGLPLGIAERAAVESFQSFIAQDAAAAAEWINKHSEIAFRDALVLALCKSLVVEDRDVGVAWAATIADSTMRQAADDIFAVAPPESGSVE